ncbi:unnamed protein product [Zymoseptoria tritici ST99CH_3D7]|uniref:Uncharacterized protein n=1 Tax=Zymoseptoria tritici (strain ST99CH_3D7) TaxID=1276538 RepID=A0A1X7RWE6_ZYMT9|nr:unnamed protein product [Zymoseptoria tritici ST99CH_3D7]
MQFTPFPNRASTQRTIQSASIRRRAANVVPVLRPREVIAAAAATWVARKLPSYCETTTPDQCNTFWLCNALAI